jgi:hypothetical protein
MTYRHVILSLVVVGSVVMARPVAGQDDELSRQTLLGLPGVFLGTPSLDQDGLRDGLDATEIRTSLSSRLGSRGIRVLNHAEFVGAPASPSLSVLAALKPYGSLCAYHVQVKVLQLVTLANGEQTFAVTWSDQRNGVESVARVREGLDELVSGFMSVWLTVNPTK